MWESVKSFFGNLMGFEKPQEPVGVPHPDGGGPIVGPYRTNPVPSSPMVEEKLVCTLTGEATRDLTIINTIKDKTRRRAIRHFAGKEVRHRVTEKKPDSIEFKFFRRTSTPLTIRWQKQGAQSEQSPTTEATPPK